MKKLRFLSVLLVSVFVVSLTACAGGGGAAGAAGTREDMILRIAIEQDIETLDSQQNTAAFTTSVGEGIHEAMLRLHNGVIVPGMAYDWHTTDYQTWTFNIRENAMWADGTPITAHCFEFSHKEIFHRPEASKVYIMFNGVKNYSNIMAAMSDGLEGDALRQVTDTLGVTALDDRTLQVVLENPDAAFIEMFAHPAWAPIHRELWEQHGANYGSSAASIAANGPFQIREWRFAEMVVLERNPNYWNYDNISLDLVEIHIVRDVEPRVNLFREGRVHSARATGEHFEVMPQYLYSIEGSSWGYILVNMHRRNAEGELVNEDISNLLANRNFVNALSHSIDREALYTRTITNPGINPATMVIPGTINSNNVARQTFSELRYCSGIHPLNADPDRAQAYLQAAMNELGITSVSDIPEIRLVVASIAEPMTIAEFVSHSVSQTLGINVSPEPIEFGVRDARIISGDYDLLIMGWGTSRNDGISFLNVWASNLFATGWPEAFPAQHSAYVDLIDQITNAPNPDERTRLMLEAEQVILQQGPFIPMSFTGDTILRQPGIGNFHLRQFGALYDYVFAYLY